MCVCFLHIHSFAPNSSNHAVWYMRLLIDGSLQAENCMDAEVIYSFLEANKIGLTHASFYIPYALHMESQNKIKTANEIFNRGLSM